ncbi:MAG: BrnA antitoxin family protein [Pseudomonadota bacterium]|nr:BrnA antitoxin family protein [Pseudomonadota bacterium]
MKAAHVKVTPEHPELDVKQIARAIVRKGLKPVPPKASVSLRIDVDVLEWFKSRGSGYQTRINAVLRAFKEATL